VVVDWFFGFALQLFWSPLANNKHGERGLFSKYLGAECFYSVRHICLLDVNMSETFSVRIPRELKEKLQANPADWSQEVRNFLTERVKQLELLKVLQELDRQPDRRKTKIDSTTLIREDRERQD
jgi:hypothetical protein